MGTEKKQDSDVIDKVATIVLAGGQGTRLHPLTESRCKPAVSFGGRYRLIDIPISNSLNSHITRIFVISQYFASDLNKHILETYRLDAFRSDRIELLCPEETSSSKVWFKGTADAVRQNLSHLMKSPSEYFLILSGDQLYNINFSQMMHFAKKTDADLVIASLPVEEPEAKRMGLLRISETENVIEFSEKPTDPQILRKFQLSHDLLQREHLKSSKIPLYLGSMGIYVFKRSALISILENEGEDFGRHIIPIQVQKGKTFAFVYTGYWEDIGTISSYYQANLALITHKTCLDVYDEMNPIYTHPHNLPSPMFKHVLVKDSLISQGSVIEAQEISQSVIGIRAHIKQGTIIRNSIIMGNHAASFSPSKPLYGIGENCLIQKAIIDEGCNIGNNVQLINKNHLDKYDGDGIYIREGIIIVTNGASVPDNFAL
ncbi:MAG: sugar phosphate nucleotidyltransferase [Anaerolineae bacterium]